MCLLLFFLIRPPQPTQTHNYLTGVACQIPNNQQRVRFTSKEGRCFLQKQMQEKHVKENMYSTLFIQKASTRPNQYSCYSMFLHHKIIPELHIWYSTLMQMVKKLMRHLHKKSMLGCVSAYSFISTFVGVEKWVKYRFFTSCSHWCFNCAFVSAFESIRKSAVLHPASPPLTLAS